MPKLIKDKVNMDIAEMLAVFVNEKFFEGSWDKHIESTTKYGSQIQREEDIPLLETLKKFEKTHNIVLFEHLPDDWKEEELPNIKYEMVVYWSEEDKAHIVEVPELPGCMAAGKTYEEAIKNTLSVIREWIETAEELGREIPKPRGRLIYA